MNKLPYPSIGETLYRDTLPNGLKISVITKPGFTRCHAFFATNYGGADRRFRLGGRYIDTPAGVAHFLEHKMFDMPDGDNALNVLAANGAQPNAFTSSGMTAYYFESTSHFYENLKMLLRFVSTPYFTPESVQKEQGIIAQEIRMCEDNPDYVIFDELMRCLYANHPIRDSVAGTIDSIAQITDETLHSCHKVFYNPSNMCLCVVGDVDPEKVKAIALELLPAEPGEVPGRDYGQPENLLPARPRFYRAMEVSAPQFIIGAKLAPQPAGDSLLRQKLVAGIALNYLYSQSSPFYSALYESGLLNADFFVDMDHAADTMTILAGGESRDPEKVLQAFADEAKKAAEKGLDPAYWSRVKKSGYGSRIRSLSSFSGLCISMADADFGGYNCLDSFAMVESITDREVRDFIAANLTPQRLAMSVITPVTLGKEVNS